MNSTQEFGKFLEDFKAAEESIARQDSQEYQEKLTKCIAHGLNFKTFLQTKALFSENETLDDLSTSSIRYLSLDFYLAKLMVRKQAIGDSIRTKNLLRIKFLKKAVQLFVQFLVTLQDYGLLDKVLSKRIDSFESLFEPNFKELYTTATDEMTAATLKRKEKIAQYKAGKELEEKINFLESRLNEQNSDEEVLRELYLVRLRHLTYEAWNQLEQILMEINLLENFTKDFAEFETTKESPSEEKADSTGYTERLESLNKPLLSKNGKVLRNFTLLDKKDQLKSKVFGYGQYGPTMTVEDFLQQEFEQNRVLQGGEEPDEEPDEDNDVWQDMQTYKARDWDEFKEANPRGSGNTINRG